MMMVSSASPGANLQQHRASLFACAHHPPIARREPQIRTRSYYSVYANHRDPLKRDRSLIDDARRGDSHLLRHAPARRAGGLDLLHERHAVRDLAEDDVLAVEPGRGDGRDEELGRRLEDGHAGG
jgi:hypothetical protein